MTFTLYWWTVPAVVSGLYAIWCMWPHYNSGMFGDIELMFEHFFWIVLQLCLWAFFGIFIR